MPLTMLLGGARSGKSALAVRLMREAPGDVAILVTAEGGDDEMIERIRQHRSARPPEWLVIEEPTEVLEAVKDVDDGAGLIIDCLTLWVSNLMGLGLADREILERARQASETARGRAGQTIVVSNEVGSGIVPVNALARRYRDMLGSVNSIWARASDAVFMTVAGGVVRVEPELRWEDLPGD
jgi:adenosyl cobinamide kinase/adenosyl cobinamide phosphate guanylyltransferase